MHVKSSVIRIHNGFASFLAAETRSFPHFHDRQSKVHAKSTSFLKSLCSRMQNKMQNEFVRTKERRAPQFERDFEDKKNDVCHPWKFRNGTSRTCQECPGGPVSRTDWIPKFRDYTYPRVACCRSETRSLSPRARPSSANVRLAQPAEGCGCGRTVSRAESAHLARYQSAQADP